jgi:hypothetical protein
MFPQSTHPLDPAPSRSPAREFFRGAMETKYPSRLRREGLEGAKAKGATGLRAGLIRPAPLRSRTQVRMVSKG